METNSTSLVTGKSQEPPGTLSEQSRETTSSNSSVTGKSQEVKDEDARLRTIMLDIIKDCEPRNKDCHRDMVQHDELIRSSTTVVTSHTSQCDESERTSEKAPIKCSEASSSSETLPRVDQQQPKTSPASKETPAITQDDAEPDFFALSLGRFPAKPNSDLTSKEAFDDKEHDDFSGSLALGLESRVTAVPSGVERKSNNESDLNRPKEEEENSGKDSEYKSLKTPRNGEDDHQEENPPKRAKPFTVRMPCNTPVTGDGCQWKKYGQKVARGSPFPRSYYRCCTTSTCEAKKQVQICPDDLSTLITTYEGAHDHPSPVISTNMDCVSSTAVTTMPRSSSSRSLPPHSIPFTSNSAAPEPSCNLSLTSPTSKKPPALTISIPKTQIPPSFSRFSPNFLAPQFLPTSPAAICSPTSMAGICSQTSLAGLYSPSSLSNFSVGSSSPFPSLLQAGTLSSSGTYIDGASLLTTSQMGTSNIWGLYSPRPQHQLNIRNNSQSLIRSSGAGNQPMQQPTSPTVICNSQISAEQTINEKITAATSFITSHPAFQSQVAAAVSSLVCNNASVVAPQHHCLGYMPSGLGSFHGLPSPLSYQLGNSLPPTPFPSPSAKAPTLYATSQNGDQSK